MCSDVFYYLAIPLTAQRKPSRALMGRILQKSLRNSGGALLWQKIVTRREGLLNHKSINVFSLSLSAVGRRWQHVEGFWAPQSLSN